MRRTLYRLMEPQRIAPKCLISERVESERSPAFLDRRRSILYYRIFSGLYGTRSPQILENQCAENARTWNCQQPWSSHE
jgi:hypothetical protein